MPYAASRAAFSERFSTPPRQPPAAAIDTLFSSRQLFRRLLAIFFHYAIRCQRPLIYVFIDELFIAITTSHYAIDFSPAAIDAFHYYCSALSAHRLLITPRHLLLSDTPCHARHCRLIRHFSLCAARFRIATLMLSPAAIAV